MKSSGDFSNLSSKALGRLSQIMTSTSTGCPKCQSPLSSRNQDGNIEQYCPVCNWEGPSITPSGIKSTDDNYE